MDHDSRSSEPESQRPRRRSRVRRFLTSLMPFGSSGDKQRRGSHDGRSGGETRSLLEQARARARRTSSVREADQVTNEVAREASAVLEAALEGYEVLERVHYGGQGVVFKAFQESANRVVAIKVMLQGPLAGERQRQRFAREVELVARLQNPHIVRLYDSGVVNGYPYFSMEYIEGLPIDDYVLVNDLNVRQTLELFAKVARAVSGAHQQAIIHRDLKPENILVDDEGEPHILDFGLAKEIMGDSGELQSVSLPGQVVGTLPYLSPEQAGGYDGLTDVRSDVYSLGVVLYQALTGLFPYPVEGPPEIVRQNILNTEPMAPRQALQASALEQIDGAIRPADLDDDVQAIVLKALEKEKGQRYQSAGDLVRDLEHYLAGDPVDARADRRFYLLKRTLRRYRVQVAVGCAFLVLFVASAATVTVLWRRAARDAKMYQAGLQAGAFLITGSLDRDAGRLEQAEEMLKQSIEIARQAPVADMEMRRMLFQASRHLAALYCDQAMAVQAQEYAHLAESTARGLVETEPTDDRHHRYLAKSFLVGALVLQLEGSRDAANSKYKQAFEIYGLLLSEKPSAREYRDALAPLLVTWGRNLEKQKRYADAYERYHEALPIYEALCREYPDAVEYQYALGHLEGQLAIWHLWQKTARDNDLAAVFLERGHSRLLGLQDSSAGIGRAWDLERTLAAMSKNQDLIRRRQARATSQPAP